MGWCSGSNIWDTVALSIIESESVANVDKIHILASLIRALRDHDWDCYGEDDTWYTDVTQEALKLADPHLYEMLREEEEWDDDLSL